MSESQEYRVQCYVMQLPGAEALNRTLLEQYSAACADPELQRSHFFAGRYENVYIPLERLPALRAVLDASRRGAAHFLQREAEAASLRVGFWFNEMGPGHVTLPHHHREDDERVSGVYYVSVPEDSGDLVLEQGAATTRIRPQAGMLVFFAPDVVHHVTENRSAEVRLSIGMNFGRPDDL
jgi:hypothetical protein